MNYQKVNRIIEDIFHIITILIMPYFVLRIMGYEKIVAIRIGGIAMQDLYENNEDFKKYVDKYCRTYRLSVAEALEHKLVQNVGRHYQELAESRVD